MKTKYLSTVIVFVIVGVMSIGCVTGQKVRAIEPGMSQAEVMATLGRPDGFRTEGDYIVLHYANRLMSGWSWDRTDYYVILKDDRVTEYGHGEVRERNVGGVHTVFIHQY